MAFTVGFDTSALDPAFKAHAQRGIGRYVRELKRYFDSLANPRAVSVGYFNHKSIGEHGPAALRAASRAVEFLPAGKTTLRQQCLYPLQLASLGEFDCLHFPAHMDPPAWGAKKYIVTVLDLIPLVCADLYKARRSTLRFRFARWLELQAIKNAALILTISENTARDVNRLLGVPWERLVVTPLGVDRKFFAARLSEPESGLRRRYNIPPQRPLVLYVGGIDPRKNYSVMLKAFKRVLDSEREQGRALPVLVMVGRIEEDREYPRLCSLVKELTLADSVVMPGFIEDTDLLQLYSLSKAFFFPSLYEGFGLPPLEAMAAGVPVVSSSSSSMPEVLGDAGLMFEPLDVEKAAQHLMAILESPTLAKDLSERGKSRATLFTWERTGEATVKAYERMNGGL